MTPEHRALYFTVMTLNLRFGRAEDGPNNWENRKNRYRAFFRKYSPDFIGMQEANDFQVDFFKELLNGYDVIGRTDSAPAHWQDNVIFFKKEWECSYGERFFISHTPLIFSRLPGSKWPRQFVIGEFSNKNISLIVVNTHFDFEPSIQKQSAEIIVKKLSGAHAHDISVIITGDFNAPPDSPAYNEFVLKSAFREVHEGEYTATTHGFTGKGRGDHIDWILYRGPVIPVKKHLITDSFDGGYPSDHFPILAQFEI